MYVRRLLSNLVTICIRNIWEILIFFCSQISSRKRIASIIDHKSRVITKIRTTPKSKTLILEVVAFLFYNVDEKYVLDTICFTHSKFCNNNAFISNVFPYFATVDNYGGTFVRGAY